MSGLLNGETIIRHLLYKQDGLEYQRQEEIPFIRSRPDMCWKTVAT